MLLFGRRISAKQACDWGLVTEVFPDHTFQKDVTARIAELGKLPQQVCIICKCGFITNAGEYLYVCISMHLGRLCRKKIQGFIFITSSKVLSVPTNSIKV